LISGMTVKQVKLSEFLIIGWAIGNTD